MPDSQLQLPFPHLKFSPDILRRLGEELNPNADQGILELVKNAFDADASTCTIELRNAATTGGAVIISDDGVGMDGVAIENNWLLLGRSSKSPDTLTKRGRVPVGNKGLGRLAALRLGNIATVISCPQAESAVEYSLRLEWDKYDRAETVEEVVLSITRRKRKLRSGPGTTIQVENLREPISRAGAKRLARGILLLADPFADDPQGFRPQLIAQEFTDLSKLVERRYFDDAEFHLRAEIDSVGKASATITDWKGNTLFSADHDELRRKAGSAAYKSPSLTFDLWNFILDKETFSTRTSTKQEVQDWLREFGGVHLYLRGFRVPPYGNPGNDWLDLNLRRSRSPEGRPSTNNSIGRIAVHDPGPALVQKTDRSGIIEDDAFEQMRLFAGDALDWMARRRLEERETRRSEARQTASAQMTKAKDSVASAIEAIPAPAQKEELQEAFSRYDKARDREASVWRKEVELYRTLSTAGITAALFSHESKQPLDLIEQNVELIDGTARKGCSDVYEKKLKGPISRITRVTEWLRAFSNLTLSQIDKDKRRARRVELHDVIKEVAAMFNPFIEQRKVTLTLHLSDKHPFLRTSSAAIESIVTNVLMNSLQAFENAPPGKHTIELGTSVAGQLCTIACLDSGPGIVDLKPRDIWLPGETTRANGTGLGLAIVRDTATDLGGTVDAVAHGVLGGAELRITLPILGA